MFIGDVVGELQFMERDRFAHPLLAGRRRVRVDVHALGHLGVGLASHEPRGILELVATVVDGSDVHRQDVLASTFQAAHFHLERRKHSPTPTKSRSEYMRYYLHVILTLDFTVY